MQCDWACYACSLVEKWRATARRQHNCFQPGKHDRHFLPTWAQSYWRLPVYGYCQSLEPDQPPAQPRCELWVKLKKDSLTNTFTHCSASSEVFSILHTASSPLSPLLLQMDQKHLRLRGQILLRPDKVRLSTVRPCRCRPVSSAGGSTASMWATLQCLQLTFCLQIWVKKSPARPIIWWQERMSQSPRCSQWLVRISARLTPWIHFVSL